MARYDTLRKTKRNAIIVDYVNLHPELSLRELGGLFGLSYESIRQILKGPKKEEVKEKRA